MMCILTFLFKIFVILIGIGVGILLLILLAYLGVLLFNEIKDEINNSRKH